MESQSDICKLIHISARKRILFLPHAVRQMSRPDRMITVKEVREIVFNGEVIEDYPDDPRGHSCLIWGQGQKERALHVVCAPKNDYLSIITAYLPDPNEWENNLKKRKLK